MRILKALDDPSLFQPEMPYESWWPWRTVLKAMHGVPLSDELHDHPNFAYDPELNPVYPTQASERTLFERIAGGRNPPEQPVGQVWCVVGRRGGKSRFCGLNAVDCAVLADHEYTAAGETVMIPIVSPDRRQCRQIKNYIKGLIDSAEGLQASVLRDNREQIEFASGLLVETQTCSFKSARGYTVPLAICEELAFWQDEHTANPDDEVVAALEYAQETVPQPLMIGISSPYAKRGVLYHKFHDYFGKDDPDILVIQAPTWVMNPTYRMERAKRRYTSDPAKAKAELGAQFRSDVESFMPDEWLNAAIRAGDTFDRPYNFDNRYFAFVDPSGGSKDRMTCAIGHREGEMCVVDAIRVWFPPFDPSVIVHEIRQFLDGYELDHVIGDRYGGEWVSEAFVKEGLAYEIAERPKADLYVEGLTQFAQSKVSMPDHPIAKHEIKNLQRSTSRNGRDVVDHPKRGHDDVANAVFGLVYYLAQNEPMNFDDIMMGPQMQSVEIFDELEAEY